MIDEREHMDMSEESALEDAITEEAARLEEGLDEPEAEETPEEAVAEETGKDEKPDSEKPDEPEEPKAVAEEPAEPEGLEAPEHWPEEVKAAFGRVDRDTQEQWLEQQKTFQRGYNELSQKHKEADEELAQFRDTHQVLREFEPYWRAQGMSITQGVGQLTQWAVALAQNPAEVLPQLAQMYGVDLATMGQEAPYVAPEDRARDSRMNSLEQRLQQQDAALAQQRQTELVGQINAFRDEPGADGAVAHPHFDSVVDSMIGMYQNGFQGPLQEAYEQCCWTNPEVRQKLIEAERVGVQETSTLQRIDDAKRAKSASQQRVRKAQPGAVSTDDDDLSDDDLIAKLAMQQAANS
jgi:hypothetical protein